MNSKLVKASSALTLFILMASVVASSAPAYASTTHGVRIGPSFGGGSLLTYQDGLKINNATFDISKHYTTIPTQNLIIGDKSNIKLKIFDNNGAKTIVSVIMFVNLKGKDPLASQTNTYIAWEKSGGVSISDPTVMFEKVTGWAKIKHQLMWLTFHIVPAKSLTGSDIIIKAWDSNYASGQEEVLNAINFGVLPAGSVNTIQ
jgi:hypothetical protein